MKTLKKIEISEISGAWLLTRDGESPKAYTQHPSLKDHIRLVKDIIKALNLELEVRER